MYTSSERRRNVLNPASASARSRSLRVSIRIGSTTLIFQGSAQLREGMIGELSVSPNLPGDSVEVCRGMGGQASG
jgi:hypothetical protein